MKDRRTRIWYTYIHCINMFVILLTIIALVTAKENEIRSDPATNQILYFKERTEGPVGVLTTSGGAPISYTEATTLNDPLINNEFFMDSMTHLNRERILERVVHSKGTGAFGYFEVTHDMSHICKASFLEKVGKRTPIVIRFSPARGERGISDLNRDIRSYSIKFYTDEGNFDVPGFNIPVYFYKDPINFPHIRHAVQRNPATNLIDAKTFWDIASYVPEMLHAFFFTFSDVGIPANYGNIAGFGIHTYQVVNKYGHIYFIKLHFQPVDGLKYLTSEEASYISARDPDYLARGLFRDIANGNYPKWTLSFQILTLADVKKLGRDRAFDVTRVIPLKEYPLHEVGNVVLNRNAKNFHAEIEQIAFCPSNLVPGIIGAPDKIFESRRFTYRDAQLHRLGANLNKIKVNRPLVKTYTYNRDGVPPVGDNEEDVPNYYPNSFHGPVPYMDNNTLGLIQIKEYKADNFDQIALLYNEFTFDERKRFFENLLPSMRTLPKFIQNKIIRIFNNIDSDLADRVSQDLSCANNYN